MSIRVGINGFGRIGRHILRIGLGREDLEFVGHKRYYGHRNPGPSFQVRFGVRPLSGGGKMRRWGNNRRWKADKGVF